MTDDPAASTEHAPATAERPPATLDRAADLVLAGVHLRLGSLALARAELETLAGRDSLDAEGILDLAEARWRTGDVEGAGEAAALVLEEEDGPLVALIVAAEAAAARGRPTEARRLAAKALAAANGSIDRIFAGMPRSPAWPPDPAAPPPAPTTMFDPPHGLASDRARQGRRQPPRRGPAAAEPTRPGPEPVAAETLTSDGTIGLWGDESEIHAPTDAVLPSASEALDRGRAAIESGDLVEASIQLALVLRLGTPLAPAVLDLVADRAEPELAFVCGDAYRLVGRELDARRAYARAAGVPPAPEAPTAPAEPLPAVPAPAQPGPATDEPQEGEPA
ncbi:MAG TPA: hypothetical protein VGQ89_01095 [Candidatus Limnocylindrales bacterium]|nr:hypothetical protein [Candidatus Limnocylindrales bacterium]